MNYKRGIAPVLLLIIVLGAGAVAGGSYYAIKKSKSAAQPASVVTGAKESEAVVPPPTDSKNSPQASSGKAVQKTTPAPAPAPKKAPIPIATPTYTEAIMQVRPGNGWPVKVSATAHVAGTIEILTRMVDMRIVPDSTNTSPFSVKISGLPANTKLYIYTNGYRNEAIQTTNASGELILTQTGPMQYIIKETQS